MTCLNWINLFKKRNGSLKNNLIKKLKILNTLYKSNISNVKKRATDREYMDYFQDNRFYDFWLI